MNYPCLAFTPSTHFVRWFFSILLCVCCVRFARAQSPTPTTAAGEDWSFPFSPAPSLYSGLFRMGTTSAPSGMVKHIGRTLSWASLNPSDGVYDFSYVDSVLATAKAGGYGVVFRLKCSLYNGSEAGQGGTQTRMIPSWVVTKHSVPLFYASASKQYASPWHGGVQAEFQKLLQEFQRRRYLESEQFIAIYLHGVSDSDGEEMYIGSATYTAQAETAAQSCGFATLSDAIMDCWQSRMEYWAQAAGPYIYKVIWVGASSWNNVPYDQALLDNYGIAQGLGLRHGFLEHYYYGSVHPPVAGQNYDGAYVTSDWSNALRDGRYWGDENEETDEYKDPTDNTLMIPAGEPRDLAYRSSFFRAAQLGMNFLWTESTPIDRAGNNDGVYTNDALPTWFTLVAGKGPAESPDAVAWLRQANVRKLPAPPWTDQDVKQSDPAQPWKNLERMLMQRDISGAMTQPAAYLFMPFVSLKIQNYSDKASFAEYTARRTDVATGNRSIAFKLDPAFRGSLGTNAVKIKVKYFDELGTTWNVKVAKGTNTPINLGSVTNGTSNTWRTATFTLAAANAPITPGTTGAPLGTDIDFVVNVPSGSNNVTVRYVRVVRTAEVAAAPSIKVHPIAQTIMPGETTTLHVVPKGPGPYTYQWKKNGASVSGATNIALDRTDADAGTYTVVVSNAAGSVTSNPAILSVLLGTVDDFEDGNVTTPAWIASGGTGGSVTITAAAVTGSEPAAHPGSLFHAIIDFGSVATWKYAVLRDATFGSTWSSKSANAIRFYLKGSVNNPAIITNSGIRVQLRESGPTDIDSGERWSSNLGTIVQGQSNSWTLTPVTVPFSSFYADGGSQGTGGTAGTFDVALINQIRFFDNAVNAALKIRVDKIEIVRQ